MPDKKLRVGLKLCGHCSPRMDMADFAERLEDEGEEIEYIYYSRLNEMMHDAQKQIDILLILNACESACAERPQFAGPVIIVTPETVDHWPVNKNELRSRVKEKLSSN